MGERAELLGQAMARFSQGDVDGFGDLLLADDVLWHWSGRSSVSGDYHGRAAALDLLRGFRELASDLLVIEPLAVLEGTDHLMSFTKVRGAKPDGSALDVVMADAMRFGPDGRVVEFWTLSNDQAAVDRFIG